MSRPDGLVLPHENPDTYRTGYYYPPLSIEELEKHAQNIAAEFEDASNLDINTRPLNDEERFVASSILRFIDTYLPQENTKPRKAGNIRLKRVCRNIGSDILSFGFAEFELDDLRQEARLASIVQLRRYDPERGANPLTLLAHAITTQTVRFGGRALSHGMGASHARGFTTGHRPFVHVKGEAFLSKSEGGYSDRFEELKAHPYYKIVEPLFGEPDETHGMTPDTPMELAHDQSDASALDGFENAERGRGLENVLSILESTGVRLTPMRKKMLEQRYVEGLSVREIAKQNGRTIRTTHQTLQIILDKIKESPEAMKELSVLLYGTE